MRDCDQDVLLNPMKFEQKRRDRFSRPLVEVPGGFVTQNYTGPADQCPGNSDTLFFATGQLGWSVVDTISQSDLFDK